MNTIRSFRLLAIATFLVSLGCSSPEKTCSDFCGKGAACVGGSCVAVSQCNPACDTGFVCQGTGSGATCVPLLSSACTGGCGEGQVCVVSSGTAACVGVCGQDEVWSSVDGQCELTASVRHKAYLNADFADGPAVTAACISCHASEANAMLGTAHFQWSGTSIATNQTPIGKRNLVNDFCVAVASNEARCTQCHPSYGKPPVKDDLGNVTDGGPVYRDPSISKIDCLVCHASPASGYGKSLGNWGAASLKNKGVCFPSCKANEFCDSDNACKVPTAEQIQATLRAATRSIVRPMRGNCGYCHFNAGGGDNVKMGDLGSALASPASRDVDVHMGAPTNPAACSDCHAGGSHQILGTGISIPVLEGGHVTCEGCHTSAPHTSSSTLNAHVQWIACQTCHIPTFSRTQYTKVDWDWMKAGDKAACQGFPGCVPIDGTGHGGEAPRSVAAPYTSYDWKKGVFTWETKVEPVYFWYNGTGTHATLTSGDFGANAGDGESNRIMVDEPLPGRTYASGAKITPFKRMTGTQPALADGSRLLVPHVFGIDGLWTSKADGSATVPASFGGGWTQGAMDAIWSSVLNYGAGVAGQIGVAARVAKSGLVRATNEVTATAQAALPGDISAGDYLYLVSGSASFPTGLKTIASIAGDRMSFTYAESGADGQVDQAVVFYRSLPAWKWVYTEMYMNLNHEVAPKEQALLCSQCHGGDKLKSLYACANPLDCKQKN